MFPDVAPAQAACCLLQAGLTYNDLRGPGAHPSAGCFPKP
eukprot:CAMPEP_0180647362 /NCGR_PEP_ID=MMETSP1037_2-20121125/50268_1 /TAXON_ID=632150 /ORGANISM="Azadinium spinosum, Strain 3D9" /LENGTH=39 /DNA_ID= /DNA_START= /DNA_END= /DNA_ORIENTATION=